MAHPPRLGHLATRAVVTAKLAPSYAVAHNIDDAEAVERVDRALQSQLLNVLLDATWAALLGDVKRLDDQGLLEKVARSLADRPLRPGRAATASPGFSAFWVQVDLAAGTASEAARRVMESEQGLKMASMGLAEAAKFLAAELTRAK